MQCRKCKVELSEGETFCRKCATSIYVDDELNNSPSNVENKSLNKLKNISLIKNKEPKVETVSSQIMSNKDLVNNNQNNMEYARNSLIKSLLLIFSLLLLLIVTIVIIIIKL